MCELARMWINQPGIFQTNHALHGTNVLVGKPRSHVSLGIDFYRVYFLQGPIISTLMDGRTLSEGWKS